MPKRIQWSTFEILIGSTAINYIVIHKFRQLINRFVPCHIEASSRINSSEKHISHGVAKLLSSMRSIHDSRYMFIHPVQSIWIAAHNNDDRVRINRHHLLDKLLLRCRQRDVRTIDRLLAINQRMVTDKYNSQIRTICRFLGFLESVHHLLHFENICSNLFLIPASHRCYTRNVNLIGSLFSTTVADNQLSCIAFHCNRHIIPC
ncbi:hypothetical protein D3C78_808940 [compost metagenome]